MGDLYSAPSASGYNSNPPVDDGSQTEANRGYWATIISKVGSPLKTYADAINTAITAAMVKTVGGAGVVDVGTSQALASSVQGKTVVATTSGITITSPDATSVESPFGFHFVNESDGNVTFDPNGSQTLDGSSDSITVPSGKGFWIETDGANWNTGGQNFAVTPQLPRNYIGGLVMSQPLLSGVPDDHDITIAVGECRSAANTSNLSLSAALTKRIDANWALGDEGGGFPSGLSLSNDTWYHVFVVDDDNGDEDAGFDTSITASNLLSDTGGSEYRRIGSVRTDGSANIIAFTQLPQGWFLWANPPLDFNSTIGNSDNTASLTVPTGVKCKAAFNVAISGTASSIVHVNSFDQDAETPSDSAAPLGQARTTGDQDPSMNYGEAFTNTSGQVRVRASQSSSAVKIATLAWLDFRGTDD